MQKILKQLGIDENAGSLITVVTEMKNRSKKKLGKWLGILFLFVMGIGFLIGFIIMVPTLINAYITTDSIKDYILITISTILFLPFLGFMTYLFLGMGFYTLTEKPKWYLILFNGHLLFKTYDEQSKEYNKETYPITSIKKCIILKTEHVNFLSIKGRARESVHYTISVHMEYEIDGESKHIHLLRPDGFNELNKAISFLQNEKDIPIYFVYAPGEKYNYEKRDERQLIQQYELERLTFNGYLEDFSEKEFTRDANWFKALESTNEYLENKNKKQTK